MATQERVDKARTFARELAGISVDSLLANPRWGTFNFRDVAMDMRLLVSLGHHMAELPIDYMPDGQLEQATAAMSGAVQAMRSVAAFDIETTPNARDTRQSLADNVRNHAQTVLIAVQGWIGFLAYQKGDVQQNLSELSRAVASASTALDQAKTYADTKAKEVDGIITAAREAAAKVGVGHFTADFAGEAERLDGEATRWLKITGVLALISLLVALALALVGLPANATTAEIANHVSSKIIVLVVLMTATVWCGRLYKASKHQAVMNHHRANALKTFEAFVKAASDDATRDAVLLETTRSIFAISPSGYLEVSEPSLEPASKLMEIVRSKPA